MRPTRLFALGLLMLCALPPVRSQEAKPVDDKAAPAKDARPAAKKPPAEDPYLTNWREYEHRDERAAGRGPQGKKLGFGFALGRPAGITGKLYFTQTIAAQVDVGATYGWNGPELDFQGHVVWHWQNILVRPQFKLSVYAGGGGRVAVWPAMVSGIPHWLPACTSSPNILGDTLGQSCQRPAIAWLPGADNIPGTIGGQVVGGVSMFLDRYPIELYAQPIGTLDLVPALGVDLGVQVGLRYYVF